MNAQGIEYTQRVRKRIGYAILFIVLLILEVMIAIFVHDEIIRPYVGDMLVVILIYCFIRILIPDKVKLLPVYVFIFAAFVEILQYFQIVSLLGLEENRFMRVLIGSVFDYWDIFCYAVGCLIVVVVEYKIERRINA